MAWTTVIILSALIVGLTERCVDGAVINEEIFNGRDAVKGQFPYQAYLSQVDFSGQSSSCGGSLISDQWVLTAAHCSYNINYTIVYLGIVYLDERSSALQYVVPKANHHVHPQYDQNTILNDIALLKLPTTALLNSYVKPIALPISAQANPATYDNLMVTASGWGKTYENEKSVHRILQFTTVKVYPHSQCVDYYKSLSNITQRNICTDKKTVYSGPCKGDSGGPLTLRLRDGRPIVVGVVSWGIRCVTSNPAVYTNVAYYLKWINSVSGIIVN